MPAAHQTIAPAGSANTSPVSAPDARLETLRAYYADTMERGQRYTGYLSAAGFAAFFTIWGGFRPIMPPWAILLTGSMMGAALILFIGFEIWKAKVMSVSSGRLAKALLTATPATFDRIMEAEGAITSRESLVAIRVWPWIFFPSVALGVGAAILLTLFGFFGSAGLMR